MRSLVLIGLFAALAGCSTHGVVHHSPYDLNRDGTMDARCPGMTYDTSKNTLYGWRSKGSDACEEQSS